MTHSNCLFVWTQRCSSYRHLWNLLHIKPTALIKYFVTRPRIFVHSHSLFSLFWFTSVLQRKCLRRDWFKILSQLYIKTAAVYQGDHSTSWFLSLTSDKAGAWGIVFVMKNMMLQYHSDVCYPIFTWCLTNTLRRAAMFFIHNWISGVVEIFLNYSYSLYILIMDAF